MMKDLKDKNVTNYLNQLCKKVNCAKNINFKFFANQCTHIVNGFFEKHGKMDGMMVWCDV